MSNKRTATLIGRLDKTPVPPSWTFLSLSTAIVLVVVIDWLIVYKVGGNRVMLIS